MTIYDNNHHQILLQAKIAMPKSTCDVAIGGLGKKHEVLYENPGFLFMSRENTRYNFIPNKFVGFRRLGYIYIYIGPHKNTPRDLGYSTFSQTHIKTLGLV